MSDAAMAMMLLDEARRLWHDAPAFSQRFTGTFADGGDTLAGRWQLSPRRPHWDDERLLTYRHDE